MIDCGYQCSRNFLKFNSLFKRTTFCECCNLSRIQKLLLRLRSPVQLQVSYTHDEASIGRTPRPHQNSCLASKSRQSFVHPCAEIFKNSFKKTTTSKSAHIQNLKFHTTTNMIQKYLPPVTEKVKRVMVPISTLKSRLKRSSPIAEHFSAESLWIQNV